MQGGGIAGLLLLQAIAKPYTVFFNLMNTISRQSLAANQYPNLKKAHCAPSLTKMVNLHSRKLSNYATSLIKI